LNRGVENIYKLLDKIIEQLSYIEDDLDALERRMRNLEDISPVQKD
jgi:prefoldin subunit 5